MAAVKYFEEAAKTNIHWFDTDAKAWLQSEGGCKPWTGWDQHASKASKILDVYTAGWAPWTKVLDDSDAPFYKWFCGAKTNAAFNEVDRHVLDGHGDELAYIEDPDPMVQGVPIKEMSRNELLANSMAAAKWLRDSQGLSLGDRVLFYLPTGIEQIVWVEACKRLGVVYCCCNPGLPKEQIADRVVDLQAKLVITFDNPDWGWVVQEALNGGSSTSGSCGVLYLDMLKVPLNAAQQKLPTPTLLAKTITLPCLTAPDLVKFSISQLWEEYGMPVPVEANFPLFVIYTSGTTGKPKGIVHVHAYLAGLVETMKVSFAANPAEDRMLTVGTLGWITGQSYQISAVLAARITSVLMRGSPTVPNPARFADTIHTHKVTIFKAGSAFLREVMSNKESMEEVRAKTTVGQLRVATFRAEPVSSAVQEFAMQTVCKNYINSYWATEHGGIALSRRYEDASQPLKPDAHTWPMPWVEADVYVYTGECTVARTWPARLARDLELSEIVCTAPYPYQFRFVWGDVEHFGEPSWTGDRSMMLWKYWRLTALEGQSTPKWAYVQGDFAMKYPDGSYTFHGRSDEVINVNGILYGTEHIEGAILRDKMLTLDSPVGHCVVTGCPNFVSGELPLAFITPSDPSRRLTIQDETRLQELVVKFVGNVTVEFCCVSMLPQTFSGKFMRNLLKNIASGRAFGDTSMISNPACIDKIKHEFDAWKCGPSVAVALSGDETIQKIVTAVGTVLGMTRSFDHDVNLRNFGVTSTMTMKLRIELQKQFGMSFCMEVFSSHPTIAKLGAYVSEQQAQDCPTPHNTMSSSVSSPLALTPQPPPLTVHAKAPSPTSVIEPTRRPGVSHMAIVDNAAHLAAGCTVGHFAIVEAGAHLGPGVVVEDGAIVKSGAAIGENCRIGLRAEVGAGVVLGTGNRIGSYCSIGGAGRVVLGVGNELGSYCKLTASIGVATVIGDNNTFRTNVAIGHAPEDYVSFPTSKGDVFIGNNNTFCENVIVHGPYYGPSPLTKIGHECYLMSNAHIGHDNILEDRVVLGPGVNLAGAVHILFRANVGMGTLVHQDTTIGQLCMVGMGTPVVRDALPFTTFVERDGTPQGSLGLNSIGLQRNGRSDEEIEELDRFYASTYDPDREELGPQALEGQWFRESFMEWDRHRRQSRHGGRPIGPMLFHK